jgi:TonB family protein
MGVRPKRRLKLSGADRSKGVAVFAPRINQVMTRILPFLVLMTAASACGSSLRGSGPATSPSHGPTSCAGSRGDDPTVYDTTQVDEKPIARSGPPLHYPTEARSRRIQGRVLFSLIVDATGLINPSSIVLVQRVHPDLDAEARRWVDHASFWPGCLSGRPVRVRVLIPVDFRVFG